MDSKRIAGILMIVAGLVVAGWFGMPHGQVDRTVFSLGAALLAAGAYLTWNREAGKK